MIIYFEGEHGVLALYGHRITGAEERRSAIHFRTRVLVDYAPGYFEVRNSFDDVQKRLMAAEADKAVALGLRDRFAITVLAAALAEDDKSKFKSFPKGAYEWADLMLAARDGKPNAGPGQQ
jgi:hypothetical protein